MKPLCEKQMCEYTSHRNTKQWMGSPVSDGEVMIKFLAITRLCMPLEKGGGHETSVLIVTKAAHPTWLSLNMMRVMPHRTVCAVLN